jgi:hypothetical protein
MAVTSGRDPRQRCGQEFVALPGKACLLGVVEHGGAAVGGQVHRLRSRQRQQLVAGRLEIGADLDRPGQRVLGQQRPAQGLVGERLAVEHQVRLGMAVAQRLLVVAEREQILPDWRSTLARLR